MKMMRQVMMIMMAKTHNTGAILASLTIYNTFIYEMPQALEASVFFGASLIASTLADISHPESRVGRRIRPLSTLINHRAGHRGPTHCLISVFILALIPLIGIMLGYNIVFWGGLGFLIGQISHIILDLLNEPGVALLYPNKKRYRLLNFQTGKIADHLILMVMLGLIVWQLSDVVVYWFMNFLENFEDLRESFVF